MKVSRYNFKSVPLASVALFAILNQGALAEEVAPPSLPPLKVTSGGVRYQSGDLSISSRDLFFPSTNTGREKIAELAKGDPMLRSAMQIFRDFINLSKEEKSVLDLWTEIEVGSPRVNDHQVTLHYEYTTGSKCSISSLHISQVWTYDLPAELKGREVELEALMKNPLTYKVEYTIPLKDIHRNECVYPHVGFAPLAQSLVDFVRREGKAFSERVNNARRLLEEQDEAKEEAQKEIEKKAAKDAEETKAINDILDEIGTRERSVESERAI